MLYIKFQGNRPIGSEEGDFWRFLPNMGLEVILVMWLGTHLNKFSFPQPKEAPHEIWPQSAQY